MASPILPYKINVPAERVDELKRRLPQTKLPSQLQPLSGSSNDSSPEWKYGVPVTEIEKLAAYWRHSFDWRKVEADLNARLPQFWTTIEVDGIGELGVHFVHQRSDVKGAIPLLFSHGWPGSFLEVEKLLPLLKDNGTDGTKPAFDIVAPSLPNFGFSDGAASKAFDLTKYAETLHKLMLKLGYDQYVTQGGDWGYSVTRALGLLYPDHVKASHINLVLCKAPTEEEHPELYKRWSSTPLSARDERALERTKWFDHDSFGYNLLQSSKPQTISFLLADSPVGLLAWIYEKLHDWSDSYPWTTDEILTWVSIYWFSNAGPEASVRIYNTAQRPEGECELVSTQSLVSTYIAGPKLGVAHFPKEIYCVPRIWAETLGDVVLQSEHDGGGHFATTERPEEVAKDLWDMFGRGGSCYGICGEDKMGY